MMEPSGIDPLGAAAVVTRVISDIDQRTDDQQDTLLSDLLRAAWGSVAAQNQ